MRKWTTHLLAEYILDTAASRQDIAATTVAGNVLIDLIGCAAAGYASPAARSVRNTVARIYTKGPSAIWFGGGQLRPEGAAMANSAAGSALDLDDGHRQAGGHPGAAIVPAVLAVASINGSSGTDVVAAMRAGYEVAVRVSAARDFARLDTLSTGRWGAYGVVAAAGLLARDTVEDLAMAFSIAGVLSPGLSAAGYSKVMGNQVKEGIPWSVLTGLTALELSRQGLTGPLDILDHTDYFDAAVIARGLSSGNAIASVYFKPYACCRWIHAAIDATVELIETASLSPGSIRSVDVFTFSRALKLNNYADPETLEGAQYSLPFCLAVAVIGGPEAMLPLSADWLHQPSVTDLAKRVKLHVDPELEACFPAETGAKVCLDTTHGRFEKTVRYPLGDPSNPMNRDKLVIKFRKLVSDKIESKDQERFLMAVNDLPNPYSVETILDCLQ